ncbi:MAG: DUF6089 family protein [Chitinophagales bacterium]
MRVIFGIKTKCQQWSQTMLWSCCLALGIFLINTNQTIQAQSSLLQQSSEVGLWIGSGTYFGDLNPDYSLRQTLPAAGVLYRFDVNPYVALRAGASFTRLQHRDAISDNPYQLARNLSFRSNILEFSGNVELHFMEYIIGDKKHFFTPYLTAGVGLFYFNPEAELNGEWYNLREVGTEGQNNSDYSGNEKYKQTYVAIPVGLGFKYWAAGAWNFYVEAAYRSTFTDYLDDVSTVYVDNFLLADDPTTVALSDRSAETGINPIGVEGKQRGDTSSNDGYMLLNVGVTYTIFNRKCKKIH